MDDPFWTDFETLPPKQQYRVIYTHPAVRRFILFILPLAIVFLLWCRASIRQIRWFCRHVFRVNLSRQRIEAVLAEKGEYLGQVNAALDKKAGERIEHVDFDCTWKGRARKVFAAICKRSHYLVILNWVKAEGAKELAPLFKKVKKLCFNLKVIYADLAKVFTQYLPRFFRWVVIKACNVHADRALQRALAELAKGAKKLARQLSAARKKLAAAMFKRDRARQKCYDKRSYVKKLKAERAQMYRDAGLTVTPSGTLESRCQGVSPEIKKETAKIQRHQARLAQLEKAQGRRERKVAQLEEQCRKLQGKYWAANAAVLRGHKLEREFWATLHDPDPRRQLDHVARFLERLERDSHPLAAKICALFKECLPLLGTTLLPAGTRLPPTKENTNDVENFFSQFRYFLDLWRNVPNTPYLQKCFEIVRAFHNLLGPRSGYNEGTSPVAALGLRCDVENVLAHLCTPPHGRALSPDIFLSSPQAIPAT